MRKDLTNSQIDRQNILNNEFAIEEKYYFTKSMLADFYDVDIRTIERYVRNNIDELREKKLIAIVL